jgi:hypothetical protein
MQKVGVGFLFLVAVLYLKPKGIARAVFEKRKIGGLRRLREPVLEVLILRLLYILERLVSRRKIA